MQNIFNSGKRIYKQTKTLYPMFLSAYCIIDTKQYIYNTEIAWRRKCAQKPELKYRIIDEKHTGS